MAEIAVAVEKLLATGLLATYKGGLSVENEYLFTNNGNTFLHVKNASAIEPVKVTIQTPRKEAGLDVAEQEVEIAKETDQFIGPFPRPTYNDANGKVVIKFDKVVSVSVAVIRV